MYRRDFLKQGAAALAVSRFPRYVEQLADTRKRVGLIGTGWYGKSDLLRLIQVAPVNVVSLCDVDKRMLSDAADLVATRQASKQKPRTYSDYREMLAREGPRHRAHRHARSLARAADDRSGQVRRSTSGCRSRSASTSSKGRRCSRRRGNTSAWSRSGCSAAARRTWSAPATASSAKGILGTIGLVEICCYYHMRATENPPDTAPPENLDYEMWTGPGTDAALQQAGAPERLARVHGVRQRHRRRHVRAHARHGALDDGPRHADAHRFVGRDTDRQGEQGQHHGFAGRDVRLPQPPGGLDAPFVRGGARSEVSVGRDLLRRQGNAQGWRDGLRLRPLG